MLIRGGVWAVLIFINRSRTWWWVDVLWVVDSKYKNNDKDQTGALQIEQSRFWLWWIWWCASENWDNSSRKSSSSVGVLFFFFFFFFYRSNRKSNIFPRTFAFFFFLSFFFSSKIEITKSPSHVKGREDTCIYCNICTMHFLLECAERWEINTLFFLK